MTAIAFPNVDLNLTAPTPWRKTRVRFNTPEWRIMRKHDGGHLMGPDMAPPYGLALPPFTAGVPSPAGEHKNAVWLPSGSWMIASWEMQMQFEREECSGNLIVSPTAVSPVDFAPGFERFVSQSQIPGVNYDPTIVTLGSYWCRKRKAASADWHAELSADLSAFPRPILRTTNVPLRRVAHHTGTLGPNQGVYLRFLGPAGPLTTQDTLLVFYFGGPVATAYADGSTDPSGGEFAIAFFGDGWALLYERTGPSVTGFWRILDRFRWEAPGRIANREHVICVVPEATDRLNILTAGTGIRYHFRSNPTHTGYVSKASMTGTGGLRLDMREDLRSPFQFGTLSFPAGGGLVGSATIYSNPFQNKFRTGVGTLIRITPYTQPLNPGTQVTVKVYDGKTNAALTDNGDGTFSTVNAGQRNYYAVLQLFDDSINYRSPILTGFDWSIEGVSTLRTPTPFEGGNVRDVQVNGPDLEVDCDSAAVLIEDVVGELATGAEGEGGLETHAGFRCEIMTAYDMDDPTLETRIFDGVLVQASGARVGRDWSTLTPDAMPAPVLGDPPYPAKRWKSWRCHFAGMWYRLNEPAQIAWQADDFMQDRTAADDPVTLQKPPWKVKDVITRCLKYAGFPDAQIHITGPDTRLFGHPQHPDDYWLQPGRPLGAFLQHMAKDYLGGRLIWDEVPQRWIMVYPPPFSGTYTQVYTFQTDSPGASLMPPHMPDGYLPQTTFVEEYTDYATEPEGNHFTVATLYVPGKSFNEIDQESLKTAEVHLAIGVNWRSADFEGYPAADPTHPDYVPRGVKAVVRSDPSLMGTTAEETKKNVRFVCRRMMDAGAYGLHWYEWKAPLALYFDPDPAYAGKPRKLRTYDIVEFIEDGVSHKLLLTSCNPHISVEEGGDLHQTANYEGYVIPEPLSY